MIRELEWQDWITYPVFLSWNKCHEMRVAKTPFGFCKLLRHADESKEGYGKWFYSAPGIGDVGPFDDDVQAKKAVEKYWHNAVSNCLDKTK